jgi:hypothetical protein
MEVYHDPRFLEGVVPLSSLAKGVGVSPGS